MSTWREAVRSQLASYQRETGQNTIDLEMFYDWALDDLRSQFPDNNHPQAKVRQCLQELRDMDEITFLGGGRYRIDALAEGPGPVPSV